MYKITFEHQPKQGEPDYEYDSIVLSKEDFLKLPQLSTDFIDENCEIYAGLFCDQTRHGSSNEFPAIWIFNPNWKLEDAEELSGGYLDDLICWIFVAIDPDLDLWIAFQFYNTATLEEAYGSTVSVSRPSHGTVYRLDSKCMEIVRKYSE